MTKKLSLLFLICILSALNINAEVYEGSCGADGDNVKYSLDTSTGVLKITGTGAMTNYAFSNVAPWYSYRSYIKNVEISVGVTSIGDYAFYYCSNLTSVTIPNSVTSIGQAAFWDCSGLTFIDIPNSVMSIGNYAFYGCSGLTSITFPNSVTSIGKGAFYGCSSLTEVTIPNSVTSIGMGAFSGCSGLSKVTLNSNAIVSGTWSISYSLLSYIFGSQIKECIIGNNVKSIGENAFRNCSDLTSVTIPNSVTSIGNNAFYGCSSLTEVTIPNSVTSIGSEAFSDCSSLSKVTLNSNAIVSKTYSSSSSLSKIFGNQIKECIIGNDVTSIGDYAFANIPKLEKIYCYAQNVPTASRNIFENSYIDYVTLYVPASSLDTYKSTAPWKNAAQILPLEDIKEKCATPIIIFENGKVSFSCETEGVKYVCNFSTPSESYGEDVEVSMPQKLQVSVYAKKDGFENSDVATKEIDLGTSGIRGDVNKDGEVNIPDAMFIVNKILNGKFPDEE